MTEIEKLVLEVTSRGLADVNQRLDRLDRGTKSATSSWTKFATGVKVAGAALLVGVGAAAVVANKLVTATRSYQDLNAQLRIATKSAKGAELAYGALVDFAATTPYSVDQATQSFVKLVNMGLTPSERALRSYGNTASSMNKEMKDFIEAVADAATGEFERLKEFGIKASKDGDKVRLTFQGITTEVANSAEAIEGYLIGIGENQFAGAMEARMQTLTGAISNLEDAWDQAWIAIARQGPDSFITGAFRLATDAITEFTAMLSSGQLGAYINAIYVQWEDTFTNIRTAVTATGSFLAEAFTLWGALGKQGTEDLNDTWKYFPLYANKALELVGGYFWKLVDDAKAAASAITAAYSSEWDRLVGIAKATGAAIKSAMTGDFNVAYNLPDQISQINKVADAKQAANKATYQAELQLNDNIFSEMKADIGAEVVAKQAAQDDLFAGAEALREKYDQDAAARKADSTDKLAQFKVGGGAGATGTQPRRSGGGGGSGKSDADRVAEKAKQDAQRLMEERLQTVEQSITGENEILAEGYAERKRLILENTATTEADKKALVLQALSESVVSETEGLRQKFETNRAFVLESTRLTEEQKTQLITKLTEEREAAVQQIEQASISKRLGDASTFFGNIASIGSTFGKKGFEIAKAASIAQATIKTYESATAAYASLAGIPYIGPALGAAAAAAAIVAGVANIAQIKSQTYQGAFAHGGSISAGKYGLVGEAGPELVRGPALVTSASTTASKTSGPSKITIQNNGQPVEATSQMNGDELMIRLKPLLAQNKAETKKELAHEVRRGGSTFAQAQESTYGLRRGSQ